MNSGSVDSPVQPFVRRVLMDDAADALRDAILSGRLAPGARLIEDDLAAMLQVSRGPIRQALTRLQHEGLVIHETHRGASVATVSADDIDEIYSLRMALERLAFARACDFATSEDFLLIERRLDAFGRIPRKLVTRQKVAEIDIDFHAAVFQAARHSRLLAAWRGLRSQVMLFLLLRDALPADYRDSWLLDHQSLLEVLRRRDKRAAMAASEAHIGAALARLRTQLSARGKV